MKSRRFIQCDVFTAHPTKGNGLAVVVDGEGLSDTQFQEFAAWTNLAETTFLLAPNDPIADYNVRIFTPKREMLFAGHPTLGSCAAWLHCGGIAKQAGVVRQECAIGIVEIDLRGAVPAFVAPPTRTQPLPEPEIRAIAQVLEIDAGTIVRSAKLENGPVWRVLELTAAADVLAVDAGAVRWPEFQAIGLIGAFEPGAEFDYAVRMLAPSSGMLEDPITGSLNAALARWVAGEGRLERDLVMRQGTQIGRQGRIHISTDPGDKNRILIGGETQIMIEGTLIL